MLDQIVPKLLEGEFICEATAPSLFRALADEAFQSEVDAFLGKIKRGESEPFYEKLALDVMGIRKIKP